MCECSVERVDSGVNVPPTTRSYRDGISVKTHPENRRSELGGRSCDRGLLANVLSTILLPLSMISCTENEMQFQV